MRTTKIIIREPRDACIGSLEHNGVQLFHFGRESKKTPSPIGQNLLYGRSQQTHVILITPGSLMKHTRNEQPIALAIRGVYIYYTDLMINR